MSLTIEIFENLKNNVNYDLEKRFKGKFQYILKKFESLSKNNNYKKIQKANIIRKPEKSNDNILNLLNKISDTNFDIISQKILLKLTKSNVVIFIDQILVYVEKSNTTAKSLWDLIKLLSICSIVNDQQKQTIKLKVKYFIDRFVSIFDVSGNDTIHTENELYMEFVERNHSNESIICQMKMVHIILNDNAFNINYNINVLFSVFINQLNTLIMDNNNDNLKYVLLQCILIMITDNSLVNNPYAYKKFLNMFNNEEIKKKLTNKIRFKLLDIIDIINIKNAV
tara:strand:+ start:2087 stop:2932 length:846 start_codon:yes stop_codon:yes gene_type:complete